MSGALDWDRRTDEAITALVGALARSQDAADIASLVVDACEHGLAPDALALFRSRHGDDTLELVGHRGLSDVAARRLARLSLADDGVLGRAVHERVVHSIDPSAEDAFSIVVRSEHPHARIELVIPFVFRNSSLGAVALGFDREEEDDEEEEVKRSVPPEALARLGTFGRVVGLALGEALSHDVALESAAAIERAQRAQLALVEALSVLPEDQLQASVRRGFYLWPQHVETSVQEFIESVLQKVADEARSLVCAELSAIGIGDEPGRPFSLWTFSGFPESARLALGRTPRPVGTLGVVACRGETLRVADVTTHPEFHGLPPGHPPLKSFLGVPIEYRGHSLGNLYLANKIGGGEFTIDDQHAIEAIARQTALALQQAFLQASVEVQRAQCQSLVDSVPNGLLFVDAEHRHVVANPSAMEIFGMTVTGEEGAEQYLDILSYPDGTPVPFDRLPSTRALRGEDHPSEQFLVRHRDGSLIPIMSTAAPVRGFGRKILGAVVNFEDLSPLRDLERLRNLERARQEFNAAVAHDLRNPIQTVLAQIYALLKKAEGGQVLVPVEALRRVERSATALGRITSLLLDVARVELRRIDLRRQPQCLADVVEELALRIRPRLEAGGHDLDLDVEGDSVVDVDPGTFEQIFDNLVDNAAKFSADHTPIRVSLRPSEGGVLLSVEDQGPGLGSEEKTRVFDRLYRTDTVRDQRAGLGLGLFIVKAYVEAHGGHVSVDSELGKGSTFHVWLPLYDLHAGAALPTTH